MADARICDTDGCSNVYAATNPDARRMNVEEPVREGTYTGVKSTSRDICPECWGRMTGRARKEPEAIEATAVEVER